jgi:hypothetical protein
MSEFLLKNWAERDELDCMKRWLVRVQSKRGLALRDVFIVAKDEDSARDRVQRMYLLSDIATVCPSSPTARANPVASAKR